MSSITGKEGEALTSAIKLGLSMGNPIPKSINEFAQHRFGADFKIFEQLPADQIVSRTTLELVRQPENMPKNRQQACFDIIRTLYSLPISTLEDEKRSRARFILNAFLGQTTIGNRPYAYPRELQDDALFTLQKIETQLPVIEETSPSETQVANLFITSPRPAKRQRTAPQAPLIPISDARIDSILRGVTLTESARKSYRLDKSMARDSNVVGDNGLTIGQWWPYRLCAIRDGAHGAMMAGIAGTEKDGAFSIVVSGMYVNLDKDHGDTLYYSGSKSHDNIDPANPIRTHSTKALETSRSENRSVRVIRGAGGDPAYAPSVGLRYDGLYRIERQEVKRNHKGGAYIRFKLVRRSGQADIDLTRPSAEERSCFERLKES